MVPTTRLAMAGALFTTGILLTGTLPVGAVPPPASHPQGQASVPDWAVPTASVRTPAAEVVAEGASQPGARTPGGGLRVLSMREVDGRPVVTSTLVGGEQAAIREVQARQQQEGTVAVEIDVPRTLAVTPTATQQPTAAAPESPRTSQAQTADRATDPFRGEQWGLDQLGAEQVWSRSRGQGVVIAVIDTGVDATHPDLAGRVLQGASFPDDGQGGNISVQAHGTHVAGIAAASADNGIGIAGVAPLATILPVRTFNARGSASVESLVDGIVYSADQGADVINMSWTERSPSQSEQAALNYARSKGAVLLAAGGNVPLATGVYPAGLDGVLAVSNQQEDGQINPGASSGTFMDIAAPGTSIVSTMPDGMYDSMSGTSMSTPAAAGAAALLLSVHPELTPDQVDQALIASARDVDEPGFDVRSGFGGVWVPGALAQADCIVGGACRPASPALTGNHTQAVINKGYVGLLGRNATGLDLLTWQGRMGAGTTVSSFAGALSGSDEYRTRFLVQTYQDKLDRVPAGDEIQLWLTHMRSGMPQPMVEANFLASQEFYNKSGGTDAGFVTHLYRQVLDRDPSAEEVAHWVQVLTTSTRYDVAYGFTMSAEYQGGQVDDWYQRLLGRPASPAERAAGVNQILSGGRIEQVIPTLLTTYEFDVLAGRSFGPGGGLRVADD